MLEDTKIGGPQTRFPLTRLSAILAVQSGNANERERGLDVIIQAYWKPVYKYVRIKWKKSNEDAKDLTQGFFTKAIDKDYFKSFDPKIARFRTFLRTCLDGFVANEEKAARRIKRGGDLQIQSLEFVAAEKELQFAAESQNERLDEYFDKEWERSLFSLSLAALKEALMASDKAVYYEIFVLYDLRESTHSGKMTYEDLARQFDLPVTKVTNFLAYSRREFRRILLDKLREITATEEEFRNEARAVLGIDP